MASLLDTSAGPVAYDEQGAGETVVMLPSGAHSRHDYDELRALLPDMRTIAIDWPAHGDSPAGGRDGSPGSLAETVEEAVAALAPQGAILVGNSVGGFSAARLAIRRPELVRALVLLDTGGFQDRTPFVWLFCALMSRPRFLRTIYPAFSAVYMRPRTAADRAARAASVATTRSDPGLRAVAELWHGFLSPEHDLRSAAPTIAAPTLMIWGRRDPVIPVRVARRIQRMIPAAQLTVLDTGHVPHTSDPEGVAAALRAFAAALDGPALDAAA